MFRDWVIWKNMGIREFHSEYWTQYKEEVNKQQTNKPLTFGGVASKICSQILCARSLPPCQVLARYLKVRRNLQPYTHTLIQTDLDFNTSSDNTKTLIIRGDFQVPTVSFIMGWIIQTPDSTS